MTIHVQQIKGLAFAGRADTNHWVAMDGPTKLGGVEAGTRPMELLLISLGGCTAMDIVSILMKKRVPMDDFAIEIESERADEHPKVYTKIHIKYIVTGRSVRAKDVERAVELSEEKYCSITAMLSKTAEMSSSYEILEV